MEQIPTEIEIAIKEASTKRYPMDETYYDFGKSQQSLKRLAFNIGAAYGYRLLCEGKEKEIAEFKVANEKFSNQYTEILNQYTEILRSRFELKERISELEAEKERLKQQIVGYKVTLEDLQHYKDTTVGLWATDRPDLINDPENILFQLTENNI